MSQGFRLFVPAPHGLHAFVDTLKQNHGFHESEEPFDGHALTMCWSGDSTEFFNISQVADGSEWISEAAEWGWIADSTRQLVVGTVVISADYNNQAMARQVLPSFVDGLGKAVVECVMDNDLGVLLRLGDVADALRVNPDWDWIRESFPELPGAPKAE